MRPRALEALVPVVHVHSTIMSGVAEIIRGHHTEIIRRWTEEAQRAASARGLDRPEFQNVVPEYLTELAAAGKELGRFAGKRRAAVERHLSSRLRQGFQLAEIVEEFALLGRCIAATWGPGGTSEPPDPREIQSLFEELHLSSVAVTEMFTRHMMEDEQVEKHYLRLIQTVASEALQPRAPDLRARLKDVLALVMDAMGAQTAALVLYDPDSGRLEVATIAGAAQEEIERYVTSLEPVSLDGHDPARADARPVHEADTTELEVSEALRRNGIHSLLGIRLLPRHRLLGVMYVGLAATRVFTAREVRRLESLGDQLTLHLDNARLYAELREQIERLDSERELREQFVTVLAHDLRGPLAAAKMSAQLLMRSPERVDGRHELELKIDRNIDRTERMIRDLLDVARIRAGHPLPLRIDECDLAGLAREVFEELVATYGERFVLDVEDRVLGFWSADELRRALWNLASNAIKYGAADGAITVRVRKHDRGASASVHNWGPPISPDDLARLFRPFSRTHGAQTGGQKGWGLGLTLVKGCALAHGGHVEVESSREAGTTFTLQLPLDARPFQQR